MSDTKCCLNGCFKVLPISEFCKDSKTPDGLSPLCATCRLTRAQVAKHGLTRADKVALAELQDGCALCGRRDTGVKGWVIDHDRSCCPGGKSCEACRRAVLCVWCNTALGYAFDNSTVLRRMADFLDLGTRIADANRRCEEGS